VSEHYLVAQLSYADCKYLGWFIVDENRPILKGIVYRPGTPRVVQGGLRWSAEKSSGSIERLIDDVPDRFLILWLTGSGSPEEFIERVGFLSDSGELVPRIPRLFSEDDFKVWLTSIGCESEEEISEVIGKLRAANIAFPAISKYAKKEGL